jgi:hypothetical protein
MLMLEIEVHPQVYSELENARSWYEERAENLGNEFLEEVDRAVHTIKDSPTTWPWYDKSKKIPLHYYNASISNILLFQEFPERPKKSAA